MKVIRTIKEMQAQSKAWTRAGETIALVPTMGALHAGHLSLMQLAKSKADRVIATIFVNPTQFAPGEDLSAYPRTFEADRLACEEEGVDVIFFPEVDEMYDATSSTWVTEEKVSQGLCAHARPTHFQGVTTVVAKLFNITLPDYAVFGEKDYQQLQVLTRMVRDLNFPIEVLPGALIREESGLAMSSRNKYLTDDEKERATVLSRSLREAQQQLQEESMDAEDLIAVVKDKITEAGGEVDYVEIRHRETLETLTASINSQSAARMILAATFGAARLLDNSDI